MDSRIGVVGIVVENIEEIGKVNEFLHEYSHLIIGRLGVPYKEKNLSVISILVDGSSDDISALTGKLGKLSGIKVKSALTKV